MADGYVSQVQLPNNETYDIKDKNAVKDITSSDIPGNINFTKGEETKDILVKDFGTAYGIDCYKGKFPLDFTSPGGAIDEWKIYGNSSGPTEVLETQSVLPTTITAHSGNAVDWEIYGNNNPVVENTTGDLPIEVSATAGNAIDWTIYGNDDNGTENLLPFADKEFTVTWGASSRLDVKCENGNLYFSGLLYEIFSTNSAWRDNLSFTLEAGTYSMNQYLTAPRYIRQKSDNTVLLDATQTTFTLSSATEVYLCFYLYKKTYDNTKVEIALVKGSTTPQSYIPYQKGVGENTEITGELPIDFRSNGDDLLGYKIYGTAEGAGVQTENMWGKGCPVYNYSSDYKKYNAANAIELLAGTYRIASDVKVPTLQVFDSNHNQIAPIENAIELVSQSYYVGWDGYALLGTATSSISAIIKLKVDATITLVSPVANGHWIMLTEGSTPPETFIPYGYKLPLVISSETKSKDIDIYIGDTKLLSDDYIDYESGKIVRNGTPQDPPLPFPELETYEGENTLDSTVEVGETMITQGYRIPLQIKQGTTTKTADIYIGNSPLTQGQSITKAQSGQDIALFSGDNIIDTSLYNKPNTSITYNSSVLGVGENTEITEELPIDFRSNGDDLLGYRIYGTADGAGVQTENLWDESWVNGIYSSVGAYTSNPSAIASDPNKPIPVQGGTTYYIKQFKNVSKIEVFFYSRATGGFISYDTIDPNVSNSFVTPQTAAYMRFDCYRVYGDVYTNDIVISTAFPTAYVPYGYKIPLTVTSGTESKTADIYIGNSKLLAEEYVDYEEQKVYKRTENDFPFAEKGTFNFGDGNIISDGEGKFVILASTPIVKNTTSQLIPLNTPYRIPQSISAGGEFVFYLGNNSVRALYLDFYDVNGELIEEWICSSPWRIVSTYTQMVWKTIAYIGFSTKNEVINSNLVITPMFSKNENLTNYIPYLQPTDPPLPFLELETYKGTNTLDSTVEVGETMITQGYRIPLQIQQGATTKTADFYIGSAPLTEGQSVTKASSGTDIALYQGENTISTTLGNKPEMRIDYLSTVVGVGERTENLYNKNATDVNNGYVNPGRLSHNGNVSTTPIANSDVSVSEYIDIEELIEYTICDHYSTANYGGCFYDKDKVYISGFTYNNVNHGTTTITSPINAKYLRLSVASYIGENQYKMMLVKGSAAPTTYIPHGYQIPIDIKQDGEVVDHKDIYIGTQPLVEGDYINQTGVYRRLHQFVNYANSSSLPNYNFIPITEQLIAGNGENTITTSLINNTTIDVELHPTKQASWICDRLEDLQRRIDNVDSTLGAPERRNYLVTWCSEDRLTGSTANLDFSFNNKDSGYSTFLIDGKSTATSAFTETINLLHMINGTVQYDGSNNYTVARPGKYVIVIFGVEMEDSSSNTITLKIIRDNVVIASQQLINEYIGCIPFEIPNDIFGNNTIIQIEVNSTTGWTDLSFGAGIAVLNATMLLQDSNLKTDTMAIGNFSMYDSYVQLLRSHRSLESKCTILENKCTVLENEYDQLANESVKDIIVYSDYTSTIPSGLSIDISQYKNKIKYVDIYFTDNNYRKGEVYPYNILAENFGYLRIPYGQIYTGASADEATRLSLSLIGDENSYYIRRELFYVSTDYEQEHLFFSQYSSVPGLILQFVGTPTNEWSDFSVKGKASEVIKIYEVHLIVSP